MPINPTREERRNALDRLAVACQYGLDYPERESDEWLVRSYRSERDPAGRR